MPAAEKPKLGRLTTPVTASFPSEISSATLATPLSAMSFPCKPEPDYIRTPISPPTAYTDFLTKAMALGSPAVASSESGSESTPTTASSERSDLSCKCERSPATSESSASTHDKPSPPATAPVIPPSPYTYSAPMSAPPTGPVSFPSLKLPPSPAISNLDSPATARSPFSARSVHSVFDWDAALKARFLEQKKQKSSRTSVRHIREVVTRTVTYTPRMEPAPRGKRRRVD